jgi:flagellar FliJ protein
MSRPFRFNLQKVLDYRAQLEDQAKQALVRAQQAHQEKAREVALLDGNLARHMEAMSSQAMQSAADIWLGRNYAKRLAEDLALARQAEAQLLHEAQERRLELVEKAKERKLLEKLKETQAKRHEQEEFRKEQAGFDEMATLRYRPPVV